MVLRSHRGAPPNILLITLDTTRADHLGAYGSRLARTPHMDRLAEEGVLFERAITAAPLTLPAHVSLLTGLYPFKHGVRNNGNFTLSGDIPTLATLLHDHGFRTAAFVSAFVLDRRYGLARGFDHYDDRFKLERRGDRTETAAESWLISSAQVHGPFFMWLHLYDPHDPYDPPSPFREAFADRPYDGEIAFVDQVVGSLIDRLDRLSLDRSTLVAVVADHGESLGEHGEATHGMFVYESDVRVPLILRWKGRLPAGRRVTQLVRSVDVAPTLLALANQPALTPSDGRSLVPLLNGRASETGAAYSETYFPRLYMNWSALRAVENDRWKFIDAPEPELYDLAHDAGEMTNLASLEPGRAKALKRAEDDVTGGREGPVTPGKVDRETAQKLAALGYVGATTERPATDGGPLPDPKAMIGVFNRLRDANAALERRRFAEAESAARAVLQADDSNAFAALILARAEMEQGRYSEALADFHNYATLVPSSADAHHWIAICYSRLGQTEDALAEEEATLAIDPRYAEAHDLRGGLLAAKGRLEEAIAELQTALVIAPDNVPFRVGLARVLLTAGRLDQAGAEIRQALSLQPDSADAHAASGSLLVARGQSEAAVTEFQRALTSRPEDADIRLDLASTLERLGRRVEARRELQRLADGRDTPPAIRRAARDHLR